MAIDWDPLLRDAGRRLQSSAIRDLLAVTTQPDMISFAGGLPAPQFFPVEALRESFDSVLRTEGVAALQYGPTEGHLPLRAFLAERLATRGIVATPEQILITSGSQQALDLLGKALLSQGASVMVEAPSYVGALQAFTTREIRYLSVEMDEQGLKVDQAARMLAGLPEPIRNGHGAPSASASGHDGRDAVGSGAARPSVAYTIATFQNPSGVTMSLARRRALLELLSRYNVPLIEDDPYGELRFEGEEVPPLRALPGGEDTIYLSTFSKILAPGLRIGWVVAPRPLLTRLILAKQAADLHSDSLVQRAILHYCRHNDIQANIGPLRELYRTRRDAMLESLARHFPDGARWTHPEGGLFIWVTLPEGLDGQAILKDAIGRKVAFVPGGAFYVDGRGTHGMRLSFSVVEPERIDEGIKRLGGVVKEHMRARALEPTVAAP